MAFGAAITVLLITSSRHDLRGPIIAAYGAFLACCGVVTIGRPMIRAGGYRAWYEKSNVIDGGTFEPTAEEIAENAELLKDAHAVQITGPALALFGTILNGLSGFF